MREAWEILRTIEAGINARSFVTMAAGPSGILIKVSVPFQKETLQLSRWIPLDLILSARDPSWWALGIVEEVNTALISRVKKVDAKPERDSAPV